MPDPPRFLRFAPSAIGLIAFGVMAVLYQAHYPLYLAIIRGVGVPPWRYPFLDSEFMYAMKHCWLHGVDIYKAVPCDVVPGNKMAYSPLWPRLPFLPSSTSARAPIGLVTDLLWLVSLNLLPPARSWRVASLMTLATLSTMVVFALERNNIDVWIYLICFTGIILFRGNSRIRIFSYLLFMLAGLLKYYPFVLFTMAVRERPRWFLAIALMSLAGLLIFVLTFWRDLREALPNVPTASPFDLMFGLRNIPLMVARLPWPGPMAGALARLSCELGLALAVLLSAYHLAARRDFAAAMWRLPAAESVWLVMGCLIMGGCYFLIQSLGYRGVYLLPVLAGLLALQRVSDSAPLSQALGRVAIAVVIIMWMEGIRYWTATLALEAGGTRALAVVFVVFWLIRELLWLYLARAMAAVVISHIAQSTLVRALPRLSPLLRALAPPTP